MGHDVAVIGNGGVGGPCKAALPITAARHRRSLLGGAPLAGLLACADALPVVPAEDLSFDGGAALLVGTDGDDEIVGSPRPDTILGDEGDDELFGAAGSDALHGGEGNDDLLGGSGDDELVGGEGDDRLRPGPGKDTTRGGPGNDTLLVEAPCEITPGEILDGGPGDDTLVTSLTLEQLAERGVAIVDIETVKINAARDGICEHHDPALRTVELTGVAIDAVSLWRDRETELWFAPDGKPHDAEVWTRTRVRVDGSYDPSLVVGTDIHLYSVGGAIDFADGISVRVTACGPPDVEIGSRYRLRLVELADGSGKIVGYRQEAYLSRPFDVGLYFWLPDGAPIPPASPSHRDRSPTR